MNIDINTLWHRELALCYQVIEMIIDSLKK